MRKNVLIGGVAYGMHNIGDESILESMLAYYTKLADVSVATFGSDWIDRLYPNVEKIAIKAMYNKPKLGLSATPRRRLLHSIRHTFFPPLSYFRDKDLFICGGGTILSDCPWHSLKCIELAHRCEIPSIIWGAGMAEIEDKTTAKYVVQICNSEAVDHIYTRDEFVKERLHRYGVDEKKISVCYDPAYMLEGVSDLSFLSDAEKEKYDDNRPNICVSLSGERDVTDMNHLREMRRFVEMASETMNVFLVPTGFGPYCRDSTLLRDLVINDRTIFIERELMPTELIAFLKNIKVIISSRLHCSIFGANVGTPSINLIRNTKHEDFAQVFQVPALKMNAVTAEMLMEMVADMLEKHAELSSAILDKLSNIRKVHMESVEEVLDKYLGKV